MPTMRASHLDSRKTVFVSREPGITDFAQELSFGAVVFVEERLRGITTRTGARIRNIAFGSAADRTNLLTIAFFVVRNQFLVSPVLAEIRDERQPINLELLVLWRM